MNIFPQLPPWDGMHVLVVHLPIGILLVTPVVLLMGFLAPKNARHYAVVALALMLLGTVAAYFAVETGEAAARVVQQTDQLRSAIEHHMDLGEDTRDVFTALTIIYALILFAPRLLRKEPARKAMTIVHIIFFVIYMGGILLVANTGDAGGKLVHQYGVKADLGPAAPAANSAPAAADENPFGGE
ncbi:MAG: hypothetical protein M1457_00775 [bacterium]|nr:hypothetical protein [bacterium]